MKIQDYCDIMLCWMVKSDQPFGGDGCLHIQGLDSTKDNLVFTTYWSTQHHIPRVLKLTQHHTDLPPGCAVMNILPSIINWSSFTGTFYMWKVYFNVIPYILEEFKPVNLLSTYGPNSRPVKGAMHIQLLNVLPPKCAMLLLYHSELHFLQFSCLRFTSKPEKFWKVRKYIYRILSFWHIYIKKTNFFTLLGRKRSERSKHNIYL
jgi:hypothetical protein